MACNKTTIPLSNLGVPMTRKANRAAAEAKPVSVATRTSFVVGLKGISDDHWVEFVQVYSPLIRYWIGLRKVPPSARDDVMQECLASFFQGIAGYERRPTSDFRGWLRTIVERRVVDYFRSLEKDLGRPWENLDQSKSPNKRAKDTGPREPEARSTEPETDDAQPEARDAGREAVTRACGIVMKKVQPNVWQMFWQSYIDQRESAEIAQEFGTTTANVRVAKKRVLDKLRKLGIDETDLALTREKPGDSRGKGVTACR